MKNMKNIFISISMVFILSSCGEEFLDKQPHEFTDAVFWKSADQAESAIKATEKMLNMIENLNEKTKNSSHVKTTRKTITLKH